MVTAASSDYNYSNAAQQKTGIVSSKARGLGSVTPKGQAFGVAKHIGLVHLAGCGGQGAETAGGNSLRAVGKMVIAWWQVVRVETYRVVTDFLVVKAPAADTEIRPVGIFKPERATCGLKFALLRIDHGTRCKVTGLQVQGRPARHRQRPRNCVQQGTET